MRAELFEKGVVYCTLDNRKQNDLQPYVYVSRNYGKSWQSITGDLPERGTAFSIRQDHVDPDLLFVGTEFGVFFSNDGGGSWHELSTLPTIAVRDLEIQRREGDLVVGTFGRGIYILDDYSPLRTADNALSAGPVLFAPRDTWLFNPDPRRGWGEKGDFGTQRYVAENPPHGAVFSYYLPEGLKSLGDQRREGEASRQEAGEDTPYPGWDRLRREDREEAPSVTLTVRDSAGEVVRRLDGPAAKGFHRVAWNMRYPAPDPVRLEADAGRSPWENDPAGPMVLPGRYTVSLAKRVEGRYQEIAEPQTVVLKPMFSGGLVTDDRAGLLEFQQKSAELHRAVLGADRAAGEIEASYGCEGFLGPYERQARTGLYYCRAGIGVADEKILAAERRPDRQIEGQLPRHGLSRHPAAGRPAPCRGGCPCIARSRSG